jgi:hypothetical protein
MLIVIRTIGVEAQWIVEVKTYKQYEKRGIWRYIPWPKEAGDGCSGPNHQP